MLRYEMVAQANAVLSRLKSNTYDRSWGDTNHSRDGDRLTLFTLNPQALAESEANLSWVITAARNLGQILIVVKTNQIQIAGAHSSKAVSDHVFPPEWLQAHNDWLGSSYHHPTPRQNCTEQGEMVEFYSHRPGFVMKEHQGVYDVKTGKRLTNRRDIIERMWALGFAAQRGRPLSISQVRWTGNREELEHATILAQLYWDRRHQSEVAKKIVSAYRSINRYAAWPGAW